MTNKIWLGILALLLLFGMIFISCGRDDLNPGNLTSAGTFTLNNIPLKYNGKYISFTTLFPGNSVSISLMSFEDINNSTVTLTPITNGSVITPLWDITDLNNPSGYSGNDTFSIGVSIWNSKIIDLTKAQDIGFILFESVQFSNGSVTKSWIEKGYNLITEDPKVLSFIVEKDGKILREYYRGDVNRNSIYDLHSVTKSVTSTLVGIALNEGLIKDLDTKIIEYFPELDNDKNEITINHLITMTTGLYSPNYFYPFNLESVLGRERIRPLGSFFEYNDYDSHILSAIIEQVTGMTADEYAYKKIFSKLGIESAFWRRDTQGITIGSYGLWLSARDALKFGKLFLNNGKWNNEQIVPKNWIDNLTTGNSSVRYQYRLNWMINNHYKMFYAVGVGGQFIFVVPELNLVASLTCDSDLLEDINKPQNNFYHFLDSLLAEKYSKH